eukprot:gene7187-1285_t
MGKSIFLMLAAAATARAGTNASLPNIVYIMTDDQDIELGGLTPMPQTRRLLGDGGATGNSMYIATPICCPSRTETLSGRLYHNVLSDDLSGCMHVNSTEYIFKHSAAIFPALEGAGYWTGGFGKIINGQGNVFHPPPGRKRAPTTDGSPSPCVYVVCRTLARVRLPPPDWWTWLSVPLDEGDYFAPDQFEKRPNGSHWVSSLGNKSEVVDDWYQTAQIGNRSLQFIDAALEAGMPFVAYLGPHAPHYSADSPPWARDLYTNLSAPRTPAYNTSVGQGDKTQHVAQNPPFDGEAEHWIDVHFRNRWRAISGVDDMVAGVLGHLEAKGVLTNTYVLFSSDHGYKLGEWRIGCSKQHPYETDVHIPFFARGPGIAPGTQLSALVSNIDIGPTMLDIAGLAPNPEHDGKSLLPMLRSRQDSDERAGLEASWRTTQIIEYISSSITESACAATENKTAPHIGEGQCYFVDSQQSNNWIAIRVRNRTDNFVYVESYRAQAMQTPIKDPKGNTIGKGVFQCLPGDLCQHELYDYGPITEDPAYPVMDPGRWCLDNKYKRLTPSDKATLHTQLKDAYCSQRRFDVDRMDCQGVRMIV